MRISDWSSDVCSSDLEFVKYLPIFRDYDQDRLTRDASACGQVLNEVDGLDRVLDQIEASLPESLRETGYAIACDIAASHGRVTAEEARMLEILRYRLQVGRMAAAAIEHGARARQMAHCTTRGASRCARRVPREHATSW